jgi:hypothetical protein
MKVMKGLEWRVQIRLFFKLIALSVQVFPDHFFRDIVKGGEIEGVKAGKKSSRLQ